MQLYPYQQLVCSNLLFNLISNINSVVCMPLGMGLTATVINALSQSVYKPTFTWVVDNQTMKTCLKNEVTRWKLELDTENVWTPISLLNRLAQGKKIPDDKVLFIEFEKNLFPRHLDIIKLYQKSTIIGLTRQPVFEYDSTIFQKLISTSTVPYVNQADIAKLFDRSILN